MERSAATVTGKTISSKKRRYYIHISPLLQEPEAKMRWNVFIFPFGLSFSNFSIQAMEALGFSIRNLIPLMLPLLYIERRLHLWGEIVGSLWCGGLAGSKIGTKEILQIGADTARQNDLGTLTVQSSSDGPVARLTLWP